MAQCKWRSWEWIGVSLLWPLGMSRALHCWLKVMASQLLKAGDLFTEHPVAASETRGTVMRREAGRQRAILPLRFIRKFTFEETLMRLYLLHILPLIFSLFSTLFPWPSPLPPAPSAPLLSTVSTRTAATPAVLKAEEDVRVLVKPPREWGYVSRCCPCHHLWHLFISLRLLGLACSLPVTMQLVFRFSKNNTFLPHVTRCTCTSLFC